MAISNIYREQITKKTASGSDWGVRVDFIPSVSDAAYYDQRTVTSLTDVFIEVKDHVCELDILKLGMVTAQSCKFTINYSNAPTAMQTALDEPTTSQTDAVLGSIDVNNLFVIWTNYGGGTYYPVFIGSQTETPSDKFTVLSNGSIQIEVDAISLHKVAADRITIEDLDTYIRSGHTYSPTFGIGKIANFAIAESKNVTSVAALPTVGGTSIDAAFMTFGEFHTAINYIYSSVMSTMLRQTFHVDIRDYTKLSLSYNMTANTKFYKQDATTALSASELYFIPYVFKRGVLNSSTEIIAGMLSLSDKEENFIKDAKTLWELLPILASNFFSKYLLGYSKQTIATHDTLACNFTLLHPIAGSTGAALQTIDYNDGTSAEWERNADLLKQCAIHTDIYTDTDYNVSLYEQAVDVVSKDKGMEFNFIFNWYTLNPYRNRRMIINGANYDLTFDLNTRGIYYMDSFRQYAVAPTTAVRTQDTGAYSTGDTGSWQYKTSQDGVKQHEMKINSNFTLNASIQWIANRYAMLFGNSGQTLYEGDFDLSQYLLPHNVGDRFNITPHSSFTLPTKALMTSCTIDWKAGASLASCKFLTRSNLYDGTE